MYEVAGACRTCKNRGWCNVKDRTRGDRCIDYKRDYTVKKKVNKDL